MKRSKKLKLKQSTSEMTDKITKWNRGKKEKFEIQL